MFMEWVVKFDKFRWEKAQKLSKADEMFEKLGYEKLLETKHHIQYAKEEYYICFNVFHKTVQKLKIMYLMGKLHCKNYKQ